MSEVYYRKWRPQRFDQVVGQEAVVRTLRHAVSQRRIAHAYLFCGPRGTGKTSTARILAKAVNCLSPQDGEPDNECEVCRSVNEGRALDLIEIDAASNRGIDDIRSLSEKIHFTPNEATYKVYIIDEVHMLTEPAFNALLKTLEEPPEHAILVLATTEPHKVPLTIISRCQRFDFRRISPDVIVDRLAQLCDDEGVEAAPEVLALVARTASGSLRDAENLLEQLVVSYGSPIVEEHARDLLDMGGDEVALDLVGHIVARSVPDGLTAINKVAEQGSDLRSLHRGVMEYLRAVMLLTTGAGSSLGYADDTAARLAKLAEAESVDRVVHALKAFSKADLRHDTASPLPLELALVEACAEPAPPPVRAPAAPASAPPRAAPRQDPVPRSGVSRPEPRARAEPAAPTRARPDSEGRAPPQSSSGPADQLETQWKEITRALRQVGKKFKIGALLIGSKERHLSDGVVTVTFSHRSHMERMQQELDNPDVRRAVNDAVSEVLGGSYEVVVSEIDGDAAAPRGGARPGGHLVRAAQAMGAQVVEEKEDEAR
ncbi:MAG: DNA polymerase III subunit gamma/tau [Chloroflexi bacterium]|nr:DNA polymerase III subunit gamma/tau [Chloroflexota bacterium]